MDNIEGILMLAPCANGNSRQLTLQTQPMKIKISGKEKMKTCQREHTSEVYRRVSLIELNEIFSQARNHKVATPKLQKSRKQNYTLTKEPDSVFCKHGLWWKPKICSLKINGTCQIWTWHGHLVLLYIFSRNTLIAWCLLADFRYHNTALSRPHFWPFWVRSRQNVSQSSEYNFQERDTKGWKNIG